MTRCAASVDASGSTPSSSPSAVAAQGNEMCAILASGVWWPAIVVGRGGCCFSDSTTAANLARMRGDVADKLAPAAAGAEATHAPSLQRFAGRTRIGRAPRDE